MELFRQLLNLPADSRALFAVAQDILMDPDRCLGQKLVALRRIDEARGGTGDPVDAAAVSEYIRCHLGDESTAPGEGET
jgi:hypothetical protein